MNRFYSTGKNSWMKFLLGGLCVLLGCLQAQAQATPAQVPAQASFIKADTTTQGNWRGVYGADGYSVAGDLQSIPPYSLYGLQNSIDYVWASYPTDADALQRASAYSRIAAAWYNQTLYFDVNFIDGNPHQFAFYALDFDNRSRTETLEVVDANLGTLLDTENLSSFTKGTYLVWNITGHVRIYVKSTGGPNAVISGAFFGGAPTGGASPVMVSPPAITLAAGQNQQFSAAVTNSSDQSVTWSISPSLGSISSTGFYTSPSTLTLPQMVTITAANPANPTQPGIATVTLLPGATASFISTDTSSGGGWEADYGFDGYAIAGDSQSVPPYASFSIQNEQEFTWNTMPTDPQALVTGNGTSKIAAAWYNGQAFHFTVHFTDHNPHELAVYALDWDNQGRAETVQILDANTNAVLDTRSISNFANGVYLAWTLSGDVIVNVIPTGGPNAVIGGVFFGGGDPPPPPAVATFVGSDAATQGNWEGVYGTDGDSLANASENIPVYATFQVLNQLNYTWTSDTNDPRALQTGFGSERIAASWYSQHFSSPPSFSFNVNFSDGNTHQLALYALDWDGVGRAETIQIIDANTNAVLDTRNLSNFATGLYMVWNISGDVNVNIISTAGPNCVISGVFFDATHAIGVSVSPQSLTLPVGQKQQFTATVSGTSNQSVVWSINPSSLGTISNAGLYTAPSTVTSSQPVTVTAKSVASPSSFGSAIVNLTTSSATFVNYDTSTLGNWHGVYGGDGYSVVNDSQVVPAFATFSVVGPNGEYTWAPYSSDPRALETGNNSGRIAACWYKNHESFTFNIAFNDGRSHQVELYALDWDQEGRYESVQVLDATTNALLDSRTISSFQNGVYLIWNVTGSVVINIEVEGGGNAVISGVFFGGATSSGGGAGAETVTVNPSGSNLMGGGTQQFTAMVTNGTGQPTWTITAVSPTGAATGMISSSGLYTAPAVVSVATAVTITATAADGLVTGTATVNLSTPSMGDGTTAAFVSPADTTTMGSWKGKYGADGYEIPNVGVNPPSYATFTVQNASAYTWNPSTGDARALQMPSGAGGAASTWYNPTSFNINVTITDAGTHQVALYALDWDYAGRMETINVTDAKTGSMLDSRTISNFGSGIYLVWNVSGSVAITVTASTGNAVVSGVFFEPTTGGGGGAETVTVNPSSSTSLQGGGTQQFTAAVTNGTGQPTWTISAVSPTGAASGTISNTGLYTAPGTVTVATVVTIKATAADGKATGTATANLSTPTMGDGTTATFVSPMDTTTMGSWKGKYGADGYEIPNLVANPPTYATFAVNATSYTWNANTSDPRALQMPTGAGGWAATWFNPTAFPMTISITDGGTHQVALYALDWDSSGRIETINVTDTKTGAVLDSETISSFVNGVYLVWNISGNVTINVVSSASNAVISGVFFEPTSGVGAAEKVVVSPSSSNLQGGGTKQLTATVTNGTGQPVWTISGVTPTGAAQGTVSSTGLYTAPGTVTVATVVTVAATAADGLASGTATVNLSAPSADGNTATFVSPVDTTTEGSWKGKYGAAGYEIPNVSANPPSYATFAVQNATAYTWNANTSDPRALQLPTGAGSWASTWFNPTAFNINVSITDGGTHQIALYALDWDSSGRSETINVTDAKTGAVLDTRSISSFTNGVYLVWNISGSVQINIVSTISNAVISGVFFQ